jgi:multiple sugar transport system permease protein
MTRRSNRRVIMAVVAIVVIALMLFPIVATFLSSIKTTAEASEAPPHYLPSALSIESYEKVFAYQAGLPVYLYNSVAVAVLTIALCLVLAVPAAYGLARFPIPAKEVLFLILLSALMIPYQALLTPLYLMFTSLGLANTHLGLAIVHTVLQLPFSIYLMRNSFEAVPRELEEAALIDGCSSLRALWHIYLPASRPALIAALVFMSDESKFTVPIMLVGVRQGHFGAVDWGALQAGVVISIVPCLLIYLLLQKHYVSGFMSGAFK